MCNVTVAYPHSPIRRSAKGQKISGTSKGIELDF